GLSLTVLDPSTRQFVDLLAQLVTLAFRVHRVADPAERVAHRLERLVRAVLDRREHGQEAALDRMQASTWRLAEVCGQEYQRQYDEQQEHRASTPDRLVVHE